MPIHNCSLKSCLIKHEIDSITDVYNFENCILVRDTQQKWLAHFYCIKIKDLSVLNVLILEKWQYLQHYWERFQEYQLPLWVGHCHENRINARNSYFIIYIRKSYHTTFNFQFNQICKWALCSGFSGLDFLFAQFGKINECIILLTNWAARCCP